MNKLFKIFVVLLLVLNVSLMIYNYKYGKIKSFIKYNPSIINFIKNKKLEIKYENKTYNKNENLKIKIILTNTNKLLLDSPKISVNINHPNGRYWIESISETKNNDKILLFMGQLEDEIIIPLNKGEGEYKLKIIVYQSLYEKIGIYEIEDLNLVVV